MWKLASAAKGKTGVFDRNTFGCQGGGVGLGFGNQYENFMGGIDGFCHTFTVPYRMFREMEENVEGSFVERDTWKSLIE